jgi:hypothetical protein
MVTGSFEDTVEFPGGQSASSNGQGDMYLVDVDPDHNLLGTYGGTGDDMGLGLAQYNGGNIFLTGAFEDDVIFGPYGGRHSAGSADAFLASYDITAGAAPAFQWVTTWGDTGWDCANAVCVYPGHMYITGSFQGTVDYDPGSNTDSRTASGFADAYICHYGSVGAYIGVTTWGGDDAFAMDAGEDIAVDGGGSVYAAGSFSGVAFGTPSNGSFDGVVAKYNWNLNLLWTAIFGGAGSDGCNGVAADHWDRIFVTGGYRDTVDFDPTSGVEDHTYNGGLSDAFLEKLYSNGLW